jgi:AcrR family transcriptional regulator
MIEPVVRDTAADRGEVVADRRAATDADGSAPAVSAPAVSAPAVSGPARTGTAAHLDGAATGVAGASTDRGRRRREAILDAAEARFLEQGFPRTSMDELGAAAGITGPGLYRHFPSKDALLMAVLDRLWAELKPAIATAAELPPDDAIEVLLTAHLELTLGQPGALVLLIRELRHLPDDYRARARRNHGRYLDAWVAALAARDDRLTREQATTLALAVHGLIEAAVTRGRPAARNGHGQRALLARLARAVLAEGASDPPDEHVARS